MKTYNRAVLPIGFKANGLACGIKKSGKLDLALFYSKAPARVAAKFTSNKIQAAPIKLCKRHLQRKRDFQALIVNSGNANCFTGSLGLRDAKETTKILAEYLGIKKESILVASTGIIGRRLPLVKIKQSLPELIRGLSIKGIDKAKKSIMTTDTFAKEVTVKFDIGSKSVTICGIAKGAGMIAPNLAYPERSRGATMLCFIFTDAWITQKALNKALDTSVGSSFNCITVDGCMSTNDSVMILANGAAGNALIERDQNFNAFVKALGIVCLKLAKMIVKDAEGATKFIQIKVSQAKNFAEAKRLALSIANSNLFKTAVFASSPNVFGRIIAGAGASGVEVKEEDLKIKFSPLNKKEVKIYVSLNRGKSTAIVYTSDLTYEYIKINAGYN